MVKNKKSRDISETVWATHIFPLQNVSKNHFHKIGKFKKFHWGKIKILKNKDELMGNIRHSLNVLLPSQRPMPKK